jgi:PAS domain S-box-containing protein
MSATQDETVAELRRAIAALQRQLDEQRAGRDAAVARETALAEVLEVINRSPGDPRPVFEAVLEKAMRLCGAAFGSLYAGPDQHFQAVTHRGIPAAFADYRATHPPASQPGSPFARMLETRRPVQSADMLTEELYQTGEESIRALVELGGARTALIVPLLKDEAVLGVIGIYRQEVGVFSEEQIALLESFAAQAVIAMENARLITEQREALERQTATAEVLQVINASPGKLEPVFDAILAKAMRLCEAAFGMFNAYDGTSFQTVVAHGVPAAFAAFRATHPPVAHPGSPFGRAFATRRPVHVVDWLEEPIYKAGTPGGRAIADLGGARTVLNVPLVKDTTVLGMISFYRQQVKPFSETHISLLESFAAQAVIAMENARLLTEQREALEQQTATAEVLGVINASPGDLASVFDTMLEKALELCGAAFGVLWTYDGESVHAVALRGVQPAFAEFLTRAPHPVDPDNAHGRLLSGEPVVHIADVTVDGAYHSGDPIRRTLVELGGGRTLLAVPLRKDATFLGDFVIYRLEVRPFSDKQIALLQNFAAQAVIAMENARLIAEQREALEQQTATTEVLQIINSSPGDPAPAFKKMLEEAMRLCEAAYGEMYSYDGHHSRPLAFLGVPPAYAEYRERSHGMSPGAGTGAARILAGERVVHNADLMDEDAYRDGDPGRRAMVELGGARSAVHVALIKDDAVHGYMIIYRQELRPFSDKQIALLENFAAQAVIAMENARLLDDLRQRTSDLQEALEYQTVTSDVLKVISRSAFDLNTVLQTVVAAAVNLCRAERASLYRYRDGRCHFEVGHNNLPEYEALERGAPIAAGPETLVGRTMQERRTVQIVDALSDPDYGPKTEALIGDIRSMLGVPLLRDGVLIGVFGLARTVAEPFTDRQVELVTTFADQAVIAIENARLLGELQARTDELAQRQTELRVTFENMGDGVAMFDETPRLVAWNRKFQEILDVPGGLLAGRQTFAEYIRYLAERGEFGAGIDPEVQLRSLTEKAGQHYSYQRTRPDGRVIEVRHNPVPGGGFVLIYADITERKQNEAQISAARDAAEQASRTIDAAFRELKAAQANLIQAEKMASLGQLTAGIAHEIKNPLNFVNNFAILSVELLAEFKETAAPALDALGDEKRADVDEIVGLLTSNLEKITEHGRRADGIVKSMLEHSRGGSGERRRVDLNVLVEEALNLAFHGARAQDQSFNITLERDLDRAIAPIELVPQDMTRVFLNLFSNGFYAATRRRRSGPATDVEPTLRVTTRDLGDAVEVRVRDNGTGISTEIKDKLFQPFFTTKPTGEGTGLGLSISYDIVTQQHGGAITVDSAIDDFTEFTIRLPRNGQGRQASCPRRIVRPA